MKADAALQKALATPISVSSIVMLWPQDDPQWREEFKSAADETASPTDQRESQPTTALNPDAALATLAEAVAQVPTGLALDTAEAREAFTRKVWGALAVDSVPLKEHVEQMKALGAAEQQLREKVAACAGAFADEVSGLRFTDEACQREVDALYEEWRAQLAAQQEVFLQYAREQMAHVPERIGQVDKQKQREEYLYLDNTREYFDRVLREGWLKHLDDRIRQVQRKLAQHEAGEERLADAEVSFLRRNLERLEDGCAKLLKQVDAILPPASAETR